MKRFLLSLILVMCVLIARSQTTYYWVGGTAESNISTATNWNTRQDGSAAGTKRTTPLSTDILVIDGTNIGGTTPTTGTATIVVNGATTAQLVVVNGASVVLARTAASNGTLTIANNTVGQAGLSIDASSTLQVGNPNNTNDLGIVYIDLPAPATADIFGTLKFVQASGTGSSPRLTCRTTGGVVFEAGGSMSFDNTLGTPYGSLGVATSNSSAGAIVFLSGASLTNNSIYSPFGSTSASPLAEFRSGSNYYIRTTTTTGSITSAKTFGNVFIQNNATLTTDASALNKIENLTIDAGSTLAIGTSSSTQLPITGNLVVNGTLNGTPATTGTTVLTMGGSTAQSISGTGTISVTNFIIGDNANVTLNKDITVAGAATVYGKLDFTTHQINGASTFAAQVNYQSGTGITQTGATVTSGSYQIIIGTNLSLSSLAGLSISGTGVSPGTNIISYSSANGQINISQPATATASGVTLTFSSAAATLATSNTNGFDNAAGSVIVSGTKSYTSGINYIVNAATTTPVGVSTSGTNPTVGNLTLNANATTNANITVNGALTLGSSVAATLGSALSIGSTGTLNLGAGATLNTGGQLTLKSDISGSATVTALGAGASITGNTTVERYLADKRSWRLVSGITTNGSQTINAAWQEGAASAAADPKPGYGTLMIGGSTTNGFDIAGTSGSLLTYNGTAFVNAANTSSMALSSNPAYFLFSIGNRSTSPTAAGAHSSTTLRSTGALNAGVQATTVNATGFTLVGNPYASAIDFAQVTRSPSISNQFYAWDINLGTYGGYVLVSNSGSGYTSVPSSPSGLSNIIPAGGAIFVQSNGTIPGTVTINESSKASGASNNSFSSFAIANNNSVSHNLRVNLTDASSNLVDGTMASFGPNYSDAVDADDAPKLSNFYENMALSRAGKLLTLERRKDLIAKDTIYIQLSGMNVAGYQLQIDPASFNQPGMNAYLVDAYLKTNTKIDLGQVSNIAFKVTGDAGSYKDRFSITFSPANTPAIATKTSHIGASVVAYPNPAVQKQINLSFDGLPAGEYNVTVTNTFGQVMQKSSVTYSGDASSKQLKTNYSTGVYTVNIQSAGYNQSIKVIVP